MSRYLSGRVSHASCHRLQQWLGVSVAMACSLLGATLVTAQTTPGVLKGEIVDQTHAPLPGIAVTVMGRGGARDAGPTDGAGTFEATLPPGTYTVLARAAGLTPGQARVRIAAGETSDVRLLLRRLPPDHVIVSLRIDPLDDLVIGSERETIQATTFGVTFLHRELDLTVNNLVSYRSSDETVAQVSNDSATKGLVMARAAGEAQITAEIAEDGPQPHVMSPPVTVRVIEADPPDCAVTATGTGWFACGHDPDRFTAGTGHVTCQECDITLANNEQLACTGNASTCQATAERATCDNCTLSGTGAVVAAEPPADAESPPAGNRITVDGAEVSAGGRSEATYDNGDKTVCADDRPCQLAIERRLVNDPTLQRAEVLIEKVTEGGDAEFRFFEILNHPGGHPIATSAGRGTSTVKYVSSPGTPPTPENPLPPIWFQLGEKFSDAGWVRDEIACPPFTLTPGSVPETFLLVLSAGDSVTCTFKNRKVPVGENRPTGVQLPEAGGSANTAGIFGLPPGNRIVIAGSNGFEVRDAITDQIPTAGNQLLSFLNTGSPYQNLYGVLVVGHPSGNGSDAIYTHGSGGSSIRQYFPDTGDFGFTQVQFPPGQNMTDATFFGGSPAAPGVLAVNFTGSRVRANVWRDFGDGTLTFAETSNLVTSFNLGGATSFVSAFAHDLTFDTNGALTPESTGWIATLLDGTPGQLWISDPKALFAQGTLVGSVGDSPRRIRCLASHNLCAVSNFESDSLSIVQWDGTATASITATQPVGDGPVGIDLVGDGANVKVISTGFHDHTYTVTSLAPDGTVLSNVTESVPAGCLSPGHALWLPGVPGTAVITCKGSDSYAVVMP